MLLIAGNGGVKTTRQPKDDPVLDEALRDLRYVMERVLQRIKEKRLWITEGGFVLTGDTHFNAPNYP